MRPEPPAAGIGPQAARPAAERAQGREAARSAALDSYTMLAVESVTVFNLVTSVLQESYRGEPGRVLFVGLDDDVGVIRMGEILDHHVDGVFGRIFVLTSPPSDFAR
ncbi:hypothetical protein AAH991_20115 [Microbispora sp. ZYX-F-249]|uniref:Uncharacterized protein n=1 Tax=Microbispora maris TaxID=3144104 RepID=A0ABV0AQ58_9ACTN